MNAASTFLSDSVASELSIHYHVSMVTPLLF